MLVGSREEDAHFEAHMDILVATTNPHKAREFGEILGPLGVRVQSLAELETQLPAPPEDATSFVGNARIKALAYARTLGRACLADDSGLEVDALGGAPGVHSARYAGSTGSRDERDLRNRNKLLAELEAIDGFGTAARLVCALCLVDAQGNILFETSSSLNGQVVAEPRGGNGFGYDALLFLPDVGRTAAELSAAEMNARSHRGQAARALARWLGAQVR